MTDRLSSLLQRTLQDAAEGVTEAERRVTAQHVDLRDKLQRPPEELVSSAELDQMLRERFPVPTLAASARDVATGSGGTAVAPGEPYVRPDLVEYEHVSEYPPIEAELGLRLDADVLEFEDDVPQFTEEAVDRVREEIARPIGKRRKRVLTEFSERGLPRPVVESMETDVKVRIDDGLNVTPVDALGTGIVPEAVGKIHAQLHFESE